MCRAGPLSAGTRGPAVGLETAATAREMYERRGEQLGRAGSLCTATFVQEVMMFNSKPIFTSQDRARLGRLLADPAIGFRWPTFVDDLRRKLERGRTVESHEVPRDVATMQSLVRLRDFNAGASRFFVLVYPDEADLRFGRISVLSQVGTAILGSRAGSRLPLQGERTDARLRLERVVSQPEAHAASARMRGGRAHRPQCRADGRGSPSVRGRGIRATLRPPRVALRARLRSVGRRSADRVAGVRRSLRPVGLLWDARHRGATGDSIGPRHRTTRVRWEQALVGGCR